LNTQDLIAWATAPRGGRFGVALGAERLALIPFRAPAATVLIALALAVLAVLGIQRIQIDDFPQPAVPLGVAGVQAVRAAVARFSLERI
jgi:hypothetical protein